MSRFPSDINCMGVWLRASCHVFHQTSGARVSGFGRHLNYIELFFAETMDDHPRNLEEEDFLWATICEGPLLVGDVVREGGDVLSFLLSLIDRISRRAE